jgi:hypothetical protein
MTTTAKAQRFLSRKDRLRVVQMLRLTGAERMTYKEIGEAFSRTKQAISGIAKREGIMRPRAQEEWVNRDEVAGIVKAALERALKERGL